MLKTVHADEDWIASRNPMKLRLLKAQKEKSAGLKGISLPLIVTNSILK